MFMCCTLSAWQRQDLTRKWCSAWARQRTPAGKLAVVGDGSGGVSGRVGQGDLSSGGMFELADEVSFTPPFVDLRVVVVGSEVQKLFVGVGQQMPDHGEDAVACGDELISADMAIDHVCEASFEGARASLSVMFSASFRW